MPSNNSSAPKSGPNKDRDWKKIERNYAKMLEAFKLPSEREQVEALTKLLEEAEGKTHGSSDTPTQSATSSDEPRIEESFNDVTSQEAGWGFGLPGPAKASSSAGPSTAAPQIATLSRAATTESVTDPLKGVSGWLLLFCVATTVLQPILCLQEGLASGGQPLSFSVEIPWAAFAFYVGITLWRVRPNALKLVKAYFLVQLVLAALVFLLALARASAGSHSPDEGAAMLVLGVLLLLGAMPVWIWWSYFKRSKRVRATYGANL